MFIVRSPIGETNKHEIRKWTTIKNNLIRLSNLRLLENN